MLGRIVPWATWQITLTWIKWRCCLASLICAVRRDIPSSFSAALLWLPLKCRPCLYTSYIALPHSLDFYVLTVLLTSQLPSGKCSNKSNLQNPLKRLNYYKAKACPRAGWPTRQSKDGYWRSPDVQKAFTSRQSNLCPVWAVSKLS